jgi:Pentapeptide repeats (9 copies)
MRPTHVPIKLTVADPGARLWTGVRSCCRVRTIGLPSVSGGLRASVKGARPLPADSALVPAALQAVVGSAGQTFQGAHDHVRRVVLAGQVAQHDVHRVRLVDRHARHTTRIAAHWAPDTHTTQRAGDGRMILTTIAACVRLLVAASRPVQSGELRIGRCVARRLSDWVYMSDAERDARRQVITTGAVGGLLLVFAMLVAADWVDWPAVGRRLRPHAWVIVLAGLGSVFVAVSVMTQRRQSHEGRRAVSPALSWWAVGGAAAVVAIVGWGATSWLLSEANLAKDPAAARVEAIKTGLSISAGVGAVFALLLAVRRQWHQELSTAATDHDATEKRITELYTKAVEQLGAAQAPVRLGGLYALERVAQNNPGQRQAIVNVLCAYLRMPYQLPEPLAEDADDQHVAAHRERVQEREVRLTAQRLLTAHLAPGIDPARPVTTFWPGIDLDLTNATLLDFDLCGGTVRTATFRSATFTGDADFESATFVGDVNFDSAAFTQRAGFESATFSGRYADFRSAVFAGKAHFSGLVTFAGYANFDFAGFSDSTYFFSAAFNGNASFLRTTFATAPKFHEASFAYGVPLEIEPFWTPPKVRTASEADQTGQEPPNS